ncbi:phosphate/phosphite/phosphonate ABC transporter substrate-binding protein [Evansella tamaricis]|uniref:Phosphate/phosphite/phosphonate ABC transporter substrate-binding protein n=1 Tax=Evansella tamaricis TaxID=2069301 RepID=A0ABS6JBT7_9BACI|nr:phosphate/phosphite/phosphonate ABC transporter substrate-binding protein [Evansella tamaricis]MBU9710302.1 phosphate/phosphite/phosphonate ABC transporter substrate-binding protein [Evansella tamaricis]
MKKIFTVLFSSVLALSLVACGAGEEDDTTDVADGADDTSAEDTTEDTGTEDEEEEEVAEDEITKLTMGFVPSQDAANIATTVEPLAQRLSEILGVEVDAQVMTDYTGLVEGMRTQQIDIGFLPPFGFVQAEERAGVEVILKAIRHGDDSYRAQFTVAADSEIDSIEDLINNEGYVWAYGDPTSTSGFLFPGNLFLQAGVEDLDSHFTHITVGGHDNSLIAVIDGQADFATTFEDAREVILDDYPDAMDMKVIGFTDPIPNDTISLRSELSDEWKTKIKEAFLSFNDDEAMMEVMNEVYSWTGIAEAKSEDYDIVRDTYAAFEEMLN